MVAIVSQARLPVIPASFFGIVLGLAGLANVWRAAHLAWGLPGMIGEALYAISAAVWIVVASLYALKWLLMPEEARTEAEHPVQCCFIGLGGVATLLIAQGALPYARMAAVPLFAIGAAFTLGFALWRTGLLWRGARAAAATTPVLYLPTVAGGFVAGTTAAALGWADWGQFAFGAAFFSWLAIESVLLHRLYTADTLAAPLRPTLGIQLAPPAVGATCYLSVGAGTPDLLVHAMLGYALLQALLLLRLWRWIAEQPFGAAYWAFTFGATALAAASLKLVARGDAGAVTVLAPILFVGANLLVSAIAVGTIGLLFRNRLLPVPFSPRTRDLP
jgi:tellurite resistance protein